MRMAVIALLALLLFFGCIGPEAAFRYSDVSSPCSVVASGEVRAIYGFRAISETPVEKENEYSFCLYSGQTTGNESTRGTRNYIMMMYVPYANSNDTIRENFLFENSTTQAYITDENLGLGNESFIAISRDKETGRINYISLAVLEGPSMILVTDAGYPMSGVDISNKGKLKELAEIALKRLAK